MTVTVSRRSRSGTTAPDRPFPVDEADTLLAERAVLPPDDPRRRLLRDRAIESWLDRAYGYAHRYAGRSQPVEDLRQVAALGLIKAVDGFDPGQGVPFTAYAAPTIVGELKRHFRDRGWAVRVPRRLQELVLALPAAAEALQCRLRRAPTVDELAVALRVRPEDVIDAFDAGDHYHLLSLQIPYAKGDDDNELGDLLGAVDPAIESAADRIALWPALAALPPREQRVLALRFFQERTQSQIAAELGISQMHVSRIISQALARLRRDLSGD